MEIWEVLHHKPSYNVSVLRQSWQSLLKDILEPVFSYKVHKQVEGNNVVAVDKQLPHDKVHPLHIVYLSVLARERPQNLSELLESFVALVEEAVQWKCSTNISIDLDR